MARKNVTLIYASDGARKRHLVRIIIFGTAILAVSIVCLFVVPMVRQGLYLLEQRRLLSHVVPPRTVVFEPDPQRAETLIAAGREHYLPQNLRWSSPEAQALMQKHMHSIAFYLPSSLANVLPKPHGEGLLFAHLRRTSGGIEQLVVVWVNILAVNSPGDYHFAVVGSAYTLATLHPGSRLTLVPQSKRQFWHQPVTPPFRLYAGQPDRQDASHFTIAYDLGHGSGTIDGWLRDPDSDHPTAYIVLDARDGPLDSMHNL